MSLAQTVAPTEEPVSLQEAKAHLRVDLDDEDALIAGYIASARQWCEKWTGRAFITQTWTLGLDDWADRIAIPLAPLSSVTSVDYLDENDASQTLSTTIYQVVTGGDQGGVIFRKDGQSFPSLSDLKEPITITFVAGYGLASDVPEPIRQAILLLVGHWFRNRETVGVVSENTPLEFTVTALLMAYKWSWL